MLDKHHQFALYYERDVVYLLHEQGIIQRCYADVGIAAIVCVPNGVVEFQEVAFLAEQQRENAILELAVSFGLCHFLSPFFSFYLLDVRKRKKNPKIFIFPTKVYIYDQNYQNSIL
jgi:hypothetical protein